MTKRLGQMIDEGKIDLDQYLIMHPFSASTKKVYEEALRGIDFFNELYIKNNKTYERLAIISKVFNNAERNLVVVTGYRGCGKTNFLKLVQYISDGNKPLEGFEERRKKDLENTDNINDVNEKYAISLQVIKKNTFQ
jgi:predicted AAA+ superfamily ATPase